jgi:hypothetical protein
MENQIHCFGSSAILNAKVKQTLLAAGQDWTMDLAPMHWRPNAQPAHAADRERLRPEVETIRTRFGITIGRGG